MLADTIIRPSRSHLDLLQLMPLGYMRRKKASRFARYCEASGGVARIGSKHRLSLPGRLLVRKCPAGNQCVSFRRTPRTWGAASDHNGISLHDQRRWLNTSPRGPARTLNNSVGRCLPDRHEDLRHRHLRVAVGIAGHPRSQRQTRHQRSPLRHQLAPVRYPPSGGAPHDPPRGSMWSRP